MKVKILRQQAPDTEPYWETFSYDGPQDNTVAGILDYLNYNDDITDINGNKTSRIGWECSCLQGMCGGCAMVINDEPSLACETFLRDLESSELIIQPLKKFPVVHDLVVDRSVIHENLMKFLSVNSYRPVSRIMSISIHWQNVLNADYVWRYVRIMLTEKHFSAHYLQMTVILLQQEIMPEEKK